MNPLDSMMAFRVIQHAIVNEIFAAEKSKLFRFADYPLPIIGALETLNYKRTVSVYYAEGDPSKGSMYSPTHDMIFHIDMFVTADAKADLLALERDFPEEFKQNIKANAMNAMQIAERRANMLADELIDIVYQLVMRKENDQLGVDRLKPAVDLRINNRMIFDIQKATPIREDKKNKFVTLVTQMRLKCKAKERVIGQPPIGAIGGGAIFNLCLEVNEDTITKAGVLADTTKE